MSSVCADTENGEVSTHEYNTLCRHRHTTLYTWMCACTCEHRVHICTCVGALNTCVFSGSFLKELQHCDTDDDVAMCFIKNQEAFEKYLEFLVGRVQAEAIVVSTPVQEFYKVPCLLLLSPVSWPSQAASCVALAI